MILPAHDLRSHVARSSASICTIIRLYYSSYSKVSYSDVAPIVKYKIFWLDVPMNNIVEVQKLKTNEDAGNEKLSLHLFKSSSTSHVVTQVTSNQQIHNEIEVLSVLKSI